MVSMSNGIVVVASAPAKAILFGEHFVVYGKPAIALALKKRIYAKVKVRDDDIIEVLSDLGYSKHRIDNGYNINAGDVHRHIIHSAMLTMEHLSRYKGLTITLDSEFPFSMGLGASAASSVCVIVGVAYAIMQYRLPNDDIFKLSLDAERLIHRNPSGIDSATCIYGGLVYFKDGNITRIDADYVYNALNFLVVSSKIKKDTGNMVSRVKALYESNRDEFLGLASISESITMQGINALISCNKVKLGVLMSINHALLKRIGVSNDMLDALVSKAISHGAYGAKLTGAGGGGCIISLTEYNGRLLEVFKDNDPFISSIEKEGIKIISNLQS